MMHVSVFMHICFVVVTKLHISVLLHDDESPAPQNVSADGFDIIQKLVLGSILTARAKRIVEIGLINSN